MNVVTGYKMISCRTGRICLLPYARVGSIKPPKTCLNFMTKGTLVNTQYSMASLSDSVISKRYWGLSLASFSISRKSHNPQTPTSSHHPQLKAGSIPVSAGPIPGFGAGPHIQLLLLCCSILFLLVSTVTACILLPSDSKRCAYTPTARLKLTGDIYYTENGKRI